eukprot:249732_1
MSLFLPFLISTLLLINYVFASCSTDEDCYLRGSCENTKCVCDKWAKGDNCEYLNLAPAEKSHRGYYNTTNGYNTWGGHPIKVNNTYHLFVSQMVNNCTVASFYGASEIIRAESSNHLGPYTMKQVIFAPFGHNPQITQAVDGTYLLYYIGLPHKKPKNCTAMHMSTDNELFNKYKYINHYNQYNDYDNNKTEEEAAGPIRLGWSKSIYGPWNTKTIVDSAQWTGSTNPSPFIFDNGTVLLVVSRNWCDVYNETTNKCQKKGPKDTWFMYADHWNASYKNMSNQWDIDHMNGEDPFIFSTNRGYHILFHAGGTAEGWFAYSLDAINWTQVQIASFNQNVTYSDGTNQQLCTRERPQLLFNHDGEPMSLWNGVGIGNCSAPEFTIPSWTLAQPFVGFE